MGHGQHSSGESHRSHRDRHHKHKHRHHNDAGVPVGRPYAPPNGQPVVGKLVEPAPSQGSDWPPRKHRRRGSHRFWSTTSAITTFAFVIFAIGCMAGGWLLMRSVLGGGKDVAKSGKDTGTQVAKIDTPKTEPQPTKVTDTVKPTQPAPPPPTKMADPPPVTTKKPDPPPVTKKEVPPPPPPPPPDPGVPLVFYDKDIKTIMENRCNRCHGDGTAKPKGGLDTRTIAAMMKGGDNGPALVPGDLKKSSMWTEIDGRSPSMPPKGEPQLTDEQKKLIENWIKGGAKEKAVAGAPAPTPPPGAVVLAYEKHVLPIFEKKCGSCHSATELKSGLNVTTLATLKKGGRSGFPSIVPGDLKKSLLWEYIGDTKQMPPEGSPPLTNAELDTIKQWIMAGAKDNKEAMLVAAK